MLVTAAGETFELRRPTLLGAILIKARSLMVHRDPESQREDLLRLLALVPDPRAIAPNLRKSERGWLRAAEERLAFGAPANVDARDGAAGEADLPAAAGGVRRSAEGGAARRRDARPS